MTTNDALWLAGVFDSRGSAYFSQTIVKTGKQAGRQRQGLVVQIQCGRHPGLLSAIKMAIGGGSACAHRVRTESPFASRRFYESPCFGCSARKAREALLAIKPYLRVRQDVVAEALRKDALHVDPNYHR